MTTREPYIGPEQDDTRVAWQCQYSLEPGDPACLADAKWHGITLPGVRLPEGAALAACNAHLPIMRSLVEYVHEHENPCGLPDGLFFEEENVCRLPEWDETWLLAGAAEVVTELEPVGRAP
jgi:hypothetical protein